ncbi:MAG: hypothetical protein R3277_04995 [Brumimicrobium sp.]|nr:hypothetical protein [Brumimicrobium sp.]
MRYPIIFTVIFLTALFNLSAQEDYFLSPQDKAYLFHTVRKSPILEENIGRYIEYTGEEIRFSNGELNYDSIEMIIINKPELLKIYSSEIRKAPKGILAEIANKQALWILNKVLNAQRQDNLASEGLTTDWEAFQLLLIKHLPEVALKIKDDVITIHPKVEKLNHPSLTFNDKVAMLDGFGNWTEQEKKQTIDAYTKAINEWVAERSFLIFKKLGGKADHFANVLTAVGDGSSTSGLFEEREKDERGRWNKGLPKAVGLFPYDTYIGKKDDSKKNKPEVLPMPYSIHTFETFGQGKKTNIHVDVWGYNSEKQTTVVISKKGKNYPLFGSADSRFLSPDSTFGGGITYYTMINRVKADIADLEEKVSGKKGLDYWIDYHEQKRDDKKLQIDKTEMELNNIRYSTITTNDKKYKTKSKRKQRKKRQDKVVLYYEELSAINRKIKELKEEREQVLLKKQALDRKLQGMYDLIGTEWVDYTFKDGVYLFEDSARFELKTQEFSFPGQDEKETFEVRLIAIPYTHTGDQYDEVMLHINVTDILPDYDATLQLSLNDVFEVDRYDLLQQLITPQDSIAVREFFEAMLDKKKPLIIVSRGGGIGKWSDFEVIKDPDTKELSNYPGANEKERNISKNDSVFKQLRTTYVKILIDRQIEIIVNSYTDPVKSNFSPTNNELSGLIRDFHLSQNDMLSAYRTFATLKALKGELNVLAGQYLERPEAKIVIDRLNQAIDDTRISVGRTSVKFTEFEP